MSRMLHRPRVLVVVSALLLSLSGAAAPATLAAPPPPDTRVAGIDVDATTIPQLQALMDRPPADVRPADAVLSAPDHEAEPDAPRGDHGQPDGPRGRPRRGPAPDVTATTGRCSGSRSSSRTTSTRPACRRPPAHGRSPGARRPMRSSSSGSGPPARWSSRKANLSEWANFRSGPSSSGWSGIGGQTNMAYVLDRNPCGSSSGSGVAASADLADVGGRHRDRRLDRLPVGRQRRSSASSRRSGC